MNINFTNSKLFSQYNLMSQLFGGKGKHTDMTGAANVPKYRPSFLYYDDNGIAWHSKEEAERCINGKDWKKIVPVSEQVKAERKFGRLCKI